MVEFYWNNFDFYGLTYVDLFNSKGWHHLWDCGRWFDWTHETHAFKYFKDLRFEGLNFINVGWFVFRVGT